MAFTKTGDKVNPTYLARLWAGDSSNHPVTIIDGDQLPRLTGEEWHYRNRSGDIIDHPRAYSRRGFSSMVYHHSTRAVTVGRNWLHRHRGARYHRSGDGTLSVLLPKTYWHKVHGFLCRPGYSSGQRFWLVEGKGHVYHVARQGFRHKHAVLADARLAVLIVIAELKKRRDIDRAQIALKTSGAYVGLHDSLAAGNCRIGTESWAKSHRLDIRRMYPVAQILDEARKKGSLMYAERACKAAAARHEIEMRQGSCALI